MYVFMYVLCYGIKIDNICYISKYNLIIILNLADLPCLLVYTYLCYYNVPKPIDFIG